MKTKILLNHSNKFCLINTLTFKKKTILICQKEGEVTIRQESTGVIGQKVFGGKGGHRVNLTFSLIKKFLRSSMFIRKKLNIKKLMTLKPRFVTPHSLFMNFDFVQAFLSANMNNDFKIIY